MPIDRAHGLALARYARACIRQALGGDEPEVPPGPEELERLGASFVTLRFGEVLQGCIGSVEPRRPLIEDIAKNAVSAALFDPRATPISLGDVDAMTVEVSILSPLEEIAFEDERSATLALRPHEDGVVLRCGMHQGTFLPQVWDSIPDRREFLEELKRKAGLPRDFWSLEVRLFRYSVEKFIDPAPGPAHAGVRRFASA